MGKAWDGAEIDQAATRQATLDAQTMPEDGTGRTASAWGNAAGKAGLYDFSLSGNAAFQRWCEGWATEALRVLKPGGHLLAFGGTRTYHRLVCAVEDAGFEIRDTISWLYGSGFPKSLDVSKAIDRAEVCPECEGVGWKANGSDVSEDTLASTDGAAVVTPARQGCPRCGGTGRATREVVGPRRTPDGKAYAERRPRNADGEGWDRPWKNDDESWAAHNMQTAPATPEAERWEGWGTALKPAHEPVVVARKPLSGTVAGNVLAFGTGALNIDGTRVGTDERTNAAGSLGANGIYGTMERNDSETTAAGRWPANVVLSHTEGCVQVGTRKVKGDKGSTRGQRSEGTTFRTAEEGRNRWRGDGEHIGYGGPDGTETVGAWSCTPDCPVRLLDEQTGERPGQHTQRRDTQIDSAYFGAHKDADVVSAYADTGGASRFFYCAKSSRGERNAGLEGFEEQKSSKLGAGIRASVGRDVEGMTMSEDRRAQNHHPTVKPISLMRWLVRLVTPPGGRVLDPFCGSGTTGCACALEAFDFIGLEREPEYVKIAEARIAWWHKHRGDGEAAEILAAGEARDEVEATGQLGMFD